MAQLCSLPSHADPFFVDLIDEIACHPALEHPFLQRFATETLRHDQLVAFATQHYLYSRLFARNLAAVVSNVPDERARNFLVMNMYEEIGEPARVRERLPFTLLEAGLVSPAMIAVATEEVVRQRRHDVVGWLVQRGVVNRKDVEEILREKEKRAAESTHPALFRRFLAALGLDRSVLDSLQPLPETSSFIAEFQWLCRQAHWLEGLGALGPGIECVVPAMYSRLLAGIRASGQVSSTDYVFWTVHVECDDEHGKNIVDALCPFAADAESALSIARGARRILDARRRWFTALERHVFGD